MAHSGPDRLLRTGLAALSLGAALLLSWALPQGLLHPEAALVPLSGWVDAAMTCLVRNAAVFGLAVSDMTRALSAAPQSPIGATPVLLA